jgi:hypothetical protein
MSVTRVGKSNRGATVEYMTTEGDDEEASSIVKAENTLETSSR